MRVGFTGTKEGMTDQQKRDIRFYLIESLNEGVRPDLGESEVEFHHGDCVGADVEAAGIAKELGLYVIGHPPVNDKYRAFFDSDVNRDQKEYLIRNHDIVDESDVLIATPKECEEQLRSGTWATVRYARKTGKPVILVLP